MAISIFDNKAVIPTDDMVAAALAESFVIWNELQSHMRESYPDVTSEWKHYGKASGWVLKLFSKKRNLLFFIPKDGCFRLRFGASEKAVPHIEAADLPDEVKEAVRIATPYVEGRSFDLDISSGDMKVMAYMKDRKLVDVGLVHGRQIETAKTLVQIKFEN